MAIPVGGVGITPNLDTIRVVSEMQSEFSFNTADAIPEALAVMAPGDVLLIEFPGANDMTRLSCRRPPAFRERGGGTYYLAACAQTALYPAAMHALDRRPLIFAARR